MNNRYFLQRGFSLLEILIAFSILAISLTVLLNIFSSGLRRAMISEEYQNAVVIAKSKLAALDIEEPLQEGETRGEANEKYSWSQQVFRFIDDNLEQDDQFLKPFQVFLTVQWQDGLQTRSLTLTTLKLSVSKDEI